MYDEKEPWSVKKCLLFMTPLWIFLLVLIVCFFIVYPIPMIELTFTALIAIPVMIGFFHLLDRW